MVAALDVGGTTIKAALLDEQLQPKATLRAETARSADGTALAEQVAEIVDMLAGQAGTVTPAAVGVVVPGIVDEETRICHFSANLDWREVHFGELLEDRLGLPVAFGHDVTAGGIAEFRVGAGQGARNAAFIPVGTGIAAALLLDGRIHRAGGQAGEVGHIDVGHSLKCGCGATGCLEAISSAAAIARRYTERTGRPADGAREVVDLARHGDEVAVEVVQDALDGLGHGIRTLLTLLGPEVIVLGGGLFTAADYVLEPVRDWLASHLTFQRMPELRIAKLGDEAGRLGAGLLALDRLAAH
ncbi:MULTISPECIES: ROK family protein [unclassified Amycolatopsis]|uniref:ROK family protein n=1 Tax=unclassified Amycolatopsis TaxID=2618356 RepID=UPI001FF27AC0|nr:MULTISPECIES: ROK family protein [unclassified Amycolatopsis]UOZ11593.1 ROK family protein [Amycolatopsis sp. WQ 127309]WSJ82042.1 ROK family protein [Amycolatopsis sp. NBC_01307]WSK84011.1 ROK family protein [Amycolatopsis sp. NBC_01286]